MDYLGTKYGITADMLVIRGGGIRSGYCDRTYMVTALPWYMVLKAEHRAKFKATLAQLKPGSHEWSALRSILGNDWDVKVGPDLTLYSTDIPDAIKNELGSEAFFGVPAPPVDTSDYDTRIGGIFRATFGALETGLGVLFPPLIPLGIDNYNAGKRQAETGKRTDPYIAQGISDVAQAMGANPRCAPDIGLALFEVLDFAVNTWGVMRACPGKAPARPGMGQTAITPPNYCTVGPVRLEGWHPALRIDGRVYVDHMHVQAQELAGTPFVQGRDLYGRVRLDATGRVVEVQWGQ